MAENKNGVRLGDGVADDLKQVANQELSDIGKMLIGIISKFAKEKIQGINIDELFSKKNEEDLLDLWSDQLSKKGLFHKNMLDCQVNIKFKIYNKQLI